MNPLAIEIQGHRGSRGTHPENTISAFEEAIAARANVWELDLHLTLDDVVVVVHDPTLSPELCRDEKGLPLKKPLMVRDVSFTELQKYDCGSIPNPKFPEQKAVPGSKVPSLEAIYQLRNSKAPHIRLNIETKMDGNNVPAPEFFAARILAVVRKFNAIESTLLQSFDFRTLVEAKKLEPGLQTSCLFDKNETNLCARTKAVLANVVSPHYSLVTKSMVEECHLNGIKVVPWTLNSEELWKSALDNGVDGIITDYPRKLYSFLHHVRQ